MPTVLVVDDSPGVLRIAETLLVEAGFDVSTLERGGETVARALELSPDLILLAYSLADTEGYRVCAELGESDDLAPIPIVVMNNRGEDPRDRFIRELGIVDHISKPFAPEALLAVVQHSLTKRGFRRRPFERPAVAPHFESSPAARRLADELARAIDHDDADTVVKLTQALSAHESSSLVRDVFFEREEDLGLTGDLSVVPVAEVVQLLSLQRQSGYLRVSRDDETISIALRGGQVRLVTGKNMRDEFLLGNILIQEDLVTRDELDVLLSNRRGTKQRLGAQLLKLGYLEREQLHAAMYRQSTELMYELLRWKRGRFTFESRRELPRSVLEFEFGLSTDELLMEGFRRVDEWGLIEEALPELDVVLRPVPGGDQKVGPEGLADDERDALRWVDGKRTAREVLTELHTTTFDGAKVLYRLIAARVIETEPSGL